MHKANREQTKSLKIYSFLYLKISYQYTIPVFSKAKNQFEPKLHFDSPVLLNDSFSGGGNFRHGPLEHILLRILHLFHCYVFYVRWLKQETSS